MHVAGLEPDPVHRREVTDGVGHVRVLDELRLRRGARGEVEEQRVGGLRRAVGLEVGRGAVGLGEVQPAFGGRRPDGDAGVVAGDVVELVDIGVPDDDVLGGTPVDAVPQVGRPEHRRRGDQHRAQLHRREDRVPQLDLVGEHEDDPVAPLHAVGAQPVRHAVGPLCHLRERVLPLGPVLLDDPQRRAVGRGRVGPDGVEVLQRPVELVELGPGEVAPGRVVVGLPFDEEVAGRAEALSRRSELRRRRRHGGGPPGCPERRRAGVRGSYHLGTPAHSRRTGPSCRPT